MEKNGIVSIIIPVYNAERYLRDCIQSVLDQSYDHWELILVDDGSTDNSYKICLEFADNDHRVRVYHNENHGVSYTRNFGMSVAKGEFLCFIDADDKILPDYISCLHKSLTETEADVVFCGYQFLYEDRYVQKAPRIKAGSYTFDDLSYRAIDDGTLSGILFGSVCSAMYRHDLIKENDIQFDPTVRRNEDGLFNLELLPKAKTVVISEYSGYIYRQWKSASKKSKQFTVSNELHIVSDIITQRYGGYADIEKQLRCRELSIIFWNIQRIKNVDAPFGKLAGYLKEYISHTDFHKLYRDLNFRALNKYKKILIDLIYRKQYVLFVFLVKYIKPILERRLNH